MALTKITDDLNIIQALDPEPNDVGGLTDAQFQAKFDEAGNKIKVFINDTLIGEIEAQMATREEVQGIVLGQIPDGTISKQKLDNDLIEELADIEVKQLYGARW